MNQMFSAGNNQNVWYGYLCLLSLCKKLNVTRLVCDTYQANYNFLA